MVPIILLCSLWMAATALPARAAGSEAAGERWRPAHDRLQNRAEEMASDLNHARDLLLERAASNAELLERLTPDPVRLREPGYGVLPQITQDAPPTPVEPSQQRYSIKSLAGNFAAEFRAAARLGKQAADRDTALDELVAEYERTLDRLRNLESHLGYHRYWQDAVRKYPSFFAERNEIITKVRALEEQRRGGGDEATIAAARRALVEQLAPFRPTRGLALEQRDDGWRILPVTVTTDIEDEEFLELFRQAVEAAFVDAEEVRALRFRIDLRFRRIPPAVLYPEGPPAAGDPIVPEVHRAQFPAGSLVLTTGGVSTNAWAGGWIVLGPGEMSRRTLAHEFAHLLGFDDAYLRGFDGKPDDRFGVVLVEWSGLQDDLMGNVRGGRVTPGMVETLVEAYGSR